MIIKRKWVINVIILLVITLLFIAISYQDFISEYEILEIEAAGKSNELADSKEIWIKSIKNGTKTVDLKEILHDDNWVIKENCIIYIGNQQSSLLIKINKYQDTEIKILKNSFSGIVTINMDGKSEQKDLYSEIADEYNYNISKVNIEELSIKQGIKLIGIGMIIFVLLLLLLYVQRIFKIEIIHSTYLILIIPVLFLTFTKLNLRTFFIMLAVIFAILMMKKVDQYLTTHKNRRYYILFGIMTLIIGSMCFMKPLFMCLPNDPIYITFQNLSLFILGLFIVAYFEIAIITIYMSLEKKIINSSNIESPKKKRYFCYLFIITFLILMIWSIVCYPGCMSPDSLAQWTQATSDDAQLIDDHPIIMVFIMKFLLIFSQNPFMYIVFQNILFSLVSSWILYDLYKNKNFKITYLVVISIIVPLMPNIAMNNTTIWKDIIYSISILAMTFVTYKILEDSNYLKKIYNCFILIIFMVLMALYRHNGIVPWIILTIMYLILAIKRKNTRLFIVTTISCLIIIFIRGPMLKMLDVRDSGLSGSKYNSIIKNFGATLYYGGELSEKAQGMIKDIMTNEDFIDKYNAINIDYYFYYAADSCDKWFKVANEYKFIEIIPEYIRNILQYPGIFIRDRFDSLAILISIPAHETTRNISYYYYGIYKDEKVLKNDLQPYITHLQEAEYDYIPNNIIANKLLKPYIEKCSGNSYLNIFLFKPALYIALLIIMIYYIIVSKKYDKLLIYIPIIANTLSWFIVLNHPSIRYVYYINVCVIYLILMSLADRRKEDLRKK